MEMFGTQDTGLDMDFKGNPFGPMPYLMATAEYVTKVHAICTKTGNLAQYSYRKAQSDDLVFVNSQCRRCDDSVNSVAWSDARCSAH